MNKKILVLIWAVCGFTALSAQETGSAQVGSEVQEQESLSSTKERMSKWSLQARGGISLLSYAETANEKFYKGMSDNGMAALSLEYTFTQLWGLGLSATWINNNQHNYDNSIFAFDIYASINLSNWLAPNRRWQKFNSFLNFGVGMPLTSWKNAYYISDGVKYELEDETHFSRPYIKPGLQYEYEVTKWLAAGLYVDALIGMTRPSNAQGTLCIHPTKNGGRVVLLSGVALRFKLNSKNRVHILNTTPGMTATVAADNGNCSELQALLDAQNQKMDSIAKAMNDEMQKVKSDNEKLSNQLKTTQDSLNAMKSRFVAYVNRPTAEEKNTIETAMANLRFETGKATIVASSYPNLDRIVKLLNEHDKWMANIEGHTDNVGDPVKNMTLSKERAAAVKQYLINKGIKADRIQSEGYGDTRPVAPNTTEKGRAKNRRVLLEVIVK